jgi:hypothetical protein
VFLTSILKSIRSVDTFGYTFVWKFSGNDQHKTLFGATISILISIMIFWQGFSKAQDLVTFGNDTVTSRVDITDYEKLGEINIKDLGASMPYYGIYSMYTSLNIPHHSNEVNPANSYDKNVGQPMCGDGGDCFEYFTNNFNMYWQAVDETTIEKSTWKYIPFKPRKCTVDDIGQEQIDRGILFLCPPLNDLLAM